MNTRESQHPEHKRFVAFLALCIGLVILVASCISKSTDPMTVRIGYEAILSDFPFFVAMEQGYFQAEGLQVEIIQFNTTNEQTMALMAGQVDMIPNSSLVLLLGAEAEQPGQFRVFLTHGDLGNKLLVRADSPTTAVEQLAGARIGVLPGTTMATYAKIALAPYFEDRELPTFVGIIPPGLIEALAQKQVDAILPLEPIVSAALETGIGKELLDNPLGNVITPFTGGASAIRTEFVEENPKTAAAVVRAMDRAVDFIRSDDVQARAALVKYTGFAPEVLQTAVLGRIWKLSEIEKQSVQGLADILYQQGQVKEEIDTTQWYYSSLRR